MRADAEIMDFELSGGALCLDFSNTLGDRPRCASESLSSYQDLLRFSRQAEALPIPDLERLAYLASLHGDRVEPIFRQAIELREAVYRIFSALARAEGASQADIGLLNKALHRALRHLELEPGEQGFDWAWGGPEESLARPLWPLARSAAQLLTSEGVCRIRECDSPTCSWLFIDRSRNRRRRWCDMSTCGNRAKVRRHYRRSRKTS